MKVSWILNGGDTATTAAQLVTPRSTPHHNLNQTTTRVSVHEMVTRVPAAATGRMAERIEEIAKAFIPRVELVKQIENTFRTLIEQPMFQQEEARLVMALAICGVALARVEEDRWLPRTAVNEMRKMVKWAEHLCPGCTSMLQWNQTIVVLDREQSAINKAPLLTSKDIRTILSALPSGRSRAVFWLALLVCARLGNLSGIVVESIQEDAIIYTWAQHKTAAKIGSRSQFLPFWNSEMAHEILNHLKTGPLDPAICELVAKTVRKKDYRQHSVRRTGVQVYADAGLTLEQLRTITLHSSEENLLGYVSYYSPMGNAALRGGIATSLAPTILQVMGRG